MAIQAMRQARKCANGSTPLSLVAVGHDEPEWDRVAVSPDSRVAGVVDR